MSKRILAAAVGAAALALPAAALASPHHGASHRESAAAHSGSGKAKRPHKVSFIFRGTFTAPGTVAVSGGNAHVRKGGFVGQGVTFDLSGARIVATDANGDKAVDLGDVKDGDRVLVQARLPKGTAYAAPADDGATTALPARRLVDKAGEPTDD